MSRKRKEQWQRKLQRYAARLNHKPPRSEVWFWKEWRALGMKFGDEVRNGPFADTIPDVRSKRFKYIIEVDGKVHGNAEVKKNDMRKTALWNSLGYRVYRVMPGDKEKLREIAAKVRKVRGEPRELSDALERIYGL